MQSLSYEMETTKDPRRFFDGYDELIEKSKMLASIESQVQFSGTSPSIALQKAVESKDSNTEEFIRKWHNELQNEVLYTSDSLKKQKLLNDSFDNIMLLYPRMSQENVALIESFKGEYSGSYESEIGENAITDLSTIDNMDGHEFERFCASLLIKKGYSNVQVTQAGGDFGVDVLAEKDGVKYAIQCKCYSSDLGNKCVQEAYTGRDYYKSNVAVVLTNRGFTKSAIETAKAVGVILWDRGMLKQLINEAADLA